MRGLQGGWPFHLLTYTKLAHTFKTNDQNYVRGGLPHPTHLIHLTKISESFMLESVNPTYNLWVLGHRSIGDITMQLYHRGRWIYISSVINTRPHGLRGTHMLVVYFQALVATFEACEWVPTFWQSVSKLRPDRGRSNLYVRGPLIKFETCDVAWPVNFDCRKLEARCGYGGGAWERLGCTWRSVPESRRVPKLSPLDLRLDLYNVLDYITPP